MSSKRTADFIIAMSQHPETKQAFADDPEGTMNDAGLSEEGKAALRSGDSNQVYSHLGDDAPPGCFLIL